MPTPPAPRQRVSEPPAHPPSQISIALIDGTDLQRADALAASADSLLSGGDSAESHSESQAERRRTGRAQRHWRRRAWARYLQAARAFSRAALEQRVMARAARRCHARQLARRALAGLLKLGQGNVRGVSAAAVEQQHPTPCALRSDADTGSSARPHGGISGSTRTAAAHHHPQSAAPRHDITAAELSKAARAAAPAAARYDEVEVRAAALGGQVTAAAVALRHRRTLLLLRALRMWTREACLRCGLRERTQMAALLSRTALLARSVAAWRGSSGGGDAGSGDGGGGGSSGGGGPISAAGAAVAAPQAAAAAQQRNGGSPLACSTSVDESAPLPPPPLRRAPALDTVLRGGALPGGYAGAAATATAADTHTTAASLAQLRLGQLLMTSRQADMSSITIGSSVDFSSSDARSPAMIAQRTCSGRLQARSAGLGGAAAALLPVAAPATAAVAVMQRRARSYCRDTPRTTAEESPMWRHGGGGGGDQSLEVGGLDPLDDRLGGVPQPHPYPQVPQTAAAATRAQARQRSNKVTLALNTPLSTSSLGQQQHPVPHPSPALSHHGSDLYARSMSSCAALSAGSWSVASSGVSALRDAAVAVRLRRQLRAGLVRWVDGVLALQQRSSADSVSTTGARLLQQRRAVQQWLVATRRPRTRSTAASTSAAAAAGAAAAATALRAVRQWQRSAAARARLRCAAETWRTLRPRFLAAATLRAWRQRCAPAARRRRRQHITSGHIRRNVLRHAVAQWRGSALAAAGAVRVAALADATRTRLMQSRTVDRWHCCLQRQVRMRAIGSRVLARWALTRWRRSALAPTLAATDHIRLRQLTRGYSALLGAMQRRRSLQLSSAAHNCTMTEQAICKWRRAARGKVPFMALLAGSRARRLLKQWASSARLACSTHRILSAAQQRSALHHCSSALQLWRRRAREQSAVEWGVQQAAATWLRAQLGRGVREWSHFVATQRAHRRQQLLRRRGLALLQWRARHLCARNISRRRAALAATAAAAVAALTKQRALRTWQRSAGELARRRSLAPRFTQRYVFGLWRANAAARRRDRAAHRRALRHRCRRRALLAVRTLLQSAHQRKTERAAALTAQQHWRRRQQCAGAAALHIGARRWRRRTRHLDFARALRLRRAAAGAWVRRTRVAHLLRCRRAAADAWAHRCAGLRAAARLLDFAAARRAQRRAARLAAAANATRGIKVGVQVWAHNRVRAAAAAELCVAAAAIARARVLAAAVAQWRTAGQLQQVHIAAVHRAEAKWALTARRRVVREWRAGAAAARVNSAQQDVATLNWGSTLLRRVMRAWQGWAALQHHQQQQQQELHEQRRSQSPPARRQHYRIHLLRSQHLLQPMQAQEGPACSNAGCRCVLPLPQPSRSATAAAKG
ncbi:hypothetical protein JKP88DRAFT_254316 [Tribonema minus]|uniref:Sfi1 spindle body domain-containing protein n=1 Tax=Tribonema minus TaxID=303371 RepID=A0A835Z4S6_9STRA|nr:hypothetical protein JKP88DRAFT_254316 [Tribonema minus]